MLDIITSLLRERTVILFLDEADTNLDKIHMFQRFIAPMNGEDFFFMGKPFSLAKQNLVIFYAMSSEEQKWRTEENQAQQPQKWEDFKRRVPKDNWLEPPSINSSAGERIFRAIALINGIRKTIKYARPNALFYLGWRKWSSTRELELTLRHAASLIPDSRDVLELADIAISETDVEDVEKEHKDLLIELGHSFQMASDYEQTILQKSLWSFGGDRKISIEFEKK